jgi:hypothetical protein
MNNFFEGLKNQISTFCICTDGFLILFASSLLRKILLKFLLVSMKTLTNSGDFTGSRIRISNTGSSSKRIGNLNSAFENADSQSSACDFEK